jgi:hypothetical protein
MAMTLKSAAELPRRVLTSRVRYWSASALLGVAILGSPVIAGASTNTTTISSAIGSVISVFTTSGTVNVNVTPTGAGAQTIASDTVTVSTNDSSGYTLTLGETSAATSLVSGGNSIVHSTATQTTPLALTAGTWGYRVDSLGGFGAGPTSAANSQAIATTKFAGVPASGSPNTLKATASSASNDTTTIWYSTAADTTQAAGTYTNSVTYTVTAN